MIQRSIVTLTMFILVFSLSLILDAQTGLHVFTIGFLLASVLFTSASQMVVILFFFSFFHDVRFFYPLGFTFLVTSPFMICYPLVIRLVRYRMAVLYGYLVLAASFCTFFQYKALTSPRYIFLTLVLCGVWVAIVYLYSMNMFKRLPFGLKRTLHF